MRTEINCEPVGFPVRVLFHHLFDETERVSLGLEPKPNTRLDHDLWRFVSHITNAFRFRLLAFRFRLLEFHHQCSPKNREEVSNGQSS